MYKELINVPNEPNFYNKMLKIALPIMLQNFILSFLNMIDTIMVGKLGETEIAAVGIANQYFFFFNMFLIGLSAGCSVLIAQYWGKNDTVNIKRVLGVGLISAILVSFVFMILGLFYPRQIMSFFNKDPLVIELGAKYLIIVLLSYTFTGVTFVYNYSLRSIGNSIQPMLISVIALICNLFFNYMFIFGNFGAPSMGVTGAALATVIARIVEAVILIISIYAKKGILAASIKELIAANIKFVRRAYQTIFPVIVNDLFWGLGSLVYLAVYGRIGTQAVAAIQICNTINNLFLVIIFGLASAASIMIGNSIGAGELKRSMNYAKRFSIISVLLGIILGLILALISVFLVDIFNVSEVVKQTSQIILYIISAIFFIRVLAIMLIVGILRGGGDAAHAFYIEGFTMWFIGVPLTILGAFVFNLPIYSVYALAVLEELAKSILGLIRLKSGKWINNVTRQDTGL